MSKYLLFLALFPYESTISFLLLSRHSAPFFFLDTSEIIRSHPRDTPASYNQQRCTSRPLSSSSPRPVWQFLSRPPQQQPLRPPAAQLKCKSSSSPALPITPSLLASERSTLTPTQHPRHLHRHATAPRQLLRRQRLGLSVFSPASAGDVLQQLPWRAGSGSGEAAGADLV